MKSIALAAAVGALAVGLASPPSAQARTCFRESLSDSAGHHAVMRGCSTARHHALRTTRRAVTRTTRVVTTDDYFTTTPVRTRTRYYSPRNEIVEYGSSTYTAPRTQYSTAYQPSYAMRCGPGNSANWGYNYYYGGAKPAPAAIRPLPAEAGNSPTIRCSAGATEQLRRQLSCNGRAVQHRPASRGIHAAEALSVGAPRLR